MPTLPLEGGCSCGALRYRISQAPVMVYNCHCTNCQKISGGAFSTPVTVREAGFAFTKGEPARIEWTSDAGNRRVGLFCGACGTRIANGQVQSSGVLSLRSGTLDDVSWIEPAADQWTRSAQPWVTFPEDRLKFETGPDDYAPIVAAYRAQGRWG